MKSKDTNYNKAQSCTIIQVCEGTHLKFSFKVTLFYQ